MLLWFIITHKNKNYLVIQILLLIGLVFLIYFLTDCNKTVFYHITYILSHTLFIAIETQTISHRTHENQ